MTQYIGEHLRPGQLGHFFAITSFVGALFSAYCYYMSVRSEGKNLEQSKSWLRSGRTGFVIHSAAVFSIFITLYYIIANHYFEYNYAWEHSSTSLPTKYLLSCFWEGQEGSFLLWTIWHCVLGLIVMNVSKKLETRVMTIIAMVQACLATMLLGIYFGPSIKIGSEPFMLLRTAMQGAPIFASPDYLSMIKDGSGLNVLLQNYWMVIHPPVLFLGFASTLIPFAYGIAALWKGEFDYADFVKPTIVWTLFSGAVLGTGIMMGGAWAYESLTFGGYWAWDPVENASLVPWLSLIAGLHTLLIYKATGRSLIITLVFFFTTYCLVWYSTFLTRTGVLQNTSVHAFTGEGKSLYWHILVVIGLLLIVCIGLLIKQWKKLPRVKQEEKTSSREFWMFIGSFILFLSAVQIIIVTSLPVWAPLMKIFTGKEAAPPTDPLKTYNNIQVWVAIVIGLLSGAILYLKFKTSDASIKKIYQRLGLTAIIALLVSLGIGYTQSIVTWQYDIMLFASCYAIVANIFYAISVQKMRYLQIGASVSHLGFGMILLGILLSSYNKQVISINTTGEGIFRGKDAAETAKENMENILVFKNTPVAMGDYFVTYVGDSLAGSDPRTFFILDFEKRVGNKVEEQFRIYPDVVFKGKGLNGGSAANPSTKHYWNKDIFTYVSHADDPDKKIDSSKYVSHTIHNAGDTVFLVNGYMVYGGMNPEVKNKHYQSEPGDVARGVDLAVYNTKSKVGNIQPVFYINTANGYAGMVDDSLKEMDLVVHIDKIVPDSNAISLMVKQADPKDTYIVVKAIIFPFIKVLWLGVMVMVVGFILSMMNHFAKKNRTANVLDM